MCLKNNKSRWPFHNVDCKGATTHLAASGPMSSFRHVIPAETKKKESGPLCKCFIFTPDGGSIDAVRGLAYCLMNNSGATSQPVHK
jgi:hypothetical protein